MTPAAELTLPGVANVHSHAFQRLIRGAVQRREPGVDDSFWTWRERMYAAANTLDLDAIEAAARLCYVECLEAGYTAVGEFHYLHHAPDGGAWPGDPWASSRAHLRAARQTGIRITLLWTAYHRGGFDTPLKPTQRRFATPSLDTARHALDALASEVAGPTQRLGLAIHSVRAVPRDWLGPLAALARERDLPLHVHASEQPAEVAACRAATGLTPIGLLATEGALGPDTTCVHATWLDDADLALLADSGATVALCPTTECDLGDGVPRTAELHAAGVPLCVGSDSHAVIDPFAELRLVATLARAREGKRCVLADASGEEAPTLAAIAHANGYRALGLDGAGDRVWLDTDARLLQAVAPADRLATALLGGHAGLVARVDVAGETLVANGRHIDGALRRR